MLTLITLRIYSINLQATLLNTSCIYVAYIHLLIYKYSEKYMYICDSPVVGRHAMCETCS